MQPDPEIIEDVGKSTESYIIKNDKKYIVLLICLAVLFGVLVLKWGFDIRFLIIPFFIIIAAYGHISSKIKSQFTEQIGTSLGLTYSKDAPLDSVSGKVF